MRSVDRLLTPRLTSPGERLLAFVARSPARTATALFLLLELVLWLPSFLSSPDWVREEWFFVQRTRTDGGWHAADDSTAAMRPFVRIIYAIVYGIGVEHTAVRLILPAMVIAIALCLWGLARPRIGNRWALFVGATWLLLPTHKTLDQWLAASNITLALLLSLLALIVLDRGLRWSNAALAGLLVGIGALTYEGIAPAAALAAVVVANRHAHGRRLILGLLPMGCAALPFAVAVLVLSVGPRQKLFVGPQQSFLFNFGLSNEVWGALLALFVLLASAAVLLLSLRTRSFDTSARLVAAGLVVWFVGYLPFSMSGYDAMFFGIGDRGNAVSAIGVALVYAGLLMRLPRRAFAVVAVLFALAVGLFHGMQNVEWARESHAVRTVGECLHQRQLMGEPVLFADEDGWTLEGVLATDANSDVQLYLRHGARPFVAEPVYVPFGTPDAVDVSARLKDEGSPNRCAALPDGETASTNK